MKKLFYMLLIPVMLMVMLLTAPAPALAQEGKFDLTLSVVGFYTTTAVPGEANNFFLQARNTGLSPITGIRFTADAPDGWEVTFNPDTLSTLSPGSSNTVEVHVVPPRAVNRGDYSINLIADAEETRAVTNVFLTVEATNTFWLWVGAGVTVLVIIGFIVIFLRFGRQ